MFRERAPHGGSRRRIPPRGRDRRCACCGRVRCSAGPVAGGGRPAALRVAVAGETPPTAPTDTADASKVAVRTGLLGEVSEGMPANATVRLPYAPATMPVIAAASAAAESLPSICGSMSEEGDGGRLRRGNRAHDGRVVVRGRAEARDRRGRLWAATDQESPALPRTPPPQPQRRGPERRGG